VVITERGRPLAMLVPLPTTGNPVVDQLIREGKLRPADNPAGVAALLAITPHLPGGGADTADVVSELREEGPF
jgi:antitoxin (DNA-binding transcriptional repressor) of toxin-antitoxin stability system